MPFYMFQGRYTPDALRAMIAAPQDRSDPARQLIEAAGGALHQMFFCMGSEDIIAIIEAPDDSVAMAVSMTVGASAAFSGGGTTKLMTMDEGMAAMKAAGALAASYSAPG